MREGGGERHTADDGFGLDDGGQTDGFVGPLARAEDSALFLEFCY
jgi:hypothetical protein